MRPRPAPSDSRSANSRPRAAPRASSRLARLAQPIKSTIATVIIRRPSGALNVSPQARQTSGTRQQLEPLAQDVGAAIGVLDRRGARFDDGATDGTEASRRGRADRRRAARAPRRSAIGCRPAAPTACRRPHRRCWRCPHAELCCIVAGSHTSTRSPTLRPLNERPPRRPPSPGRRSAESVAPSTDGSALNRRAQ